MTAYYTYCIIHKTTQAVNAARPPMMFESQRKYSPKCDIVTFHTLEEAVSVCNRWNLIQASIDGSKPFRVRTLRVETVPEIDPQDLVQFLKDKEKDEQLNYRPDI